MQFVYILMSCAQNSNFSRNLVPRAHVPFGQHQDTELWNNQLPRREGSTLLAQPCDCAADDLSHYDVTSEFQWPLKYDMRKVFHPMIAQRI